MPDNIDSYFKWANALNRSFKFAEAAKAYDKILKLDPDNKAAQERLEEAKKNLQRWTEIQSLTNGGRNDPGVYSIQGELLFSIGDLEASRKAFESAVNKEPRNTELLERLSEVLELSNLHEEAIPHLKRLVAIKQADYKAHFKLARLCIVTMHFDEAVRHLKMIPANQMTAWELLRY